eukprot:9821043-Prorocentrum_lima.AAC.1
MTSSLVGSEMCIRDRTLTGGQSAGPSGQGYEPNRHGVAIAIALHCRICLLYTSDAADCRRYA